MHLGSGASGLERKGVRSDRGNINREIMEQNSLLENAEKAYEEAAKKVEEIKAAVPENDNEVLELIGRAAGEKGRLVLPVVSGKHLRRISNREALQSPEQAAEFIKAGNIGSFEMLAQYMQEKEQEWQGIEEKRESLMQKNKRLDGLLKAFAEFEPCWKAYCESGKLKGFAKMKYDRQHKQEIEQFPQAKKRMAALLKKGEKLAPDMWRSQMQSVKAEMDGMHPQRAKLAAELAWAEVIAYNKSNFEREEANRARQRQRQADRTKRRGQEISI